MKRQKPLVSVILPVYNGSSFVAEAIQSILNQTYQNLELIIVNDGSTDNTLAILKRFKDDYPQKIKVISYLRNQGESAAANIGFKIAKGEFIARMDADDVSYPERLEKQVDFMLKNPNMIVSGTQADVINEKGDVVGKKTFPLYHQNIYSSYGYYHPMLHPSCIFRRSLLPNKKQLWSNTHEPNDDYYTFFGLLRFGKFANTSDTLIGYRVHKSNKSLQKPRSKVFFAFKVRMDAVQNLGYHPSILAVLVNLMQFAGVFVLPERLIVPAYHVFRGISAPEFAPRRVINSFARRSFFYIRKGLSSQATLLRHLM